MKAQSDQGRGWTCCRKLALVMGLLAMSPLLCCCATYFIEDLNDFYFFVAGPHYYNQTMTKVPEFDQLNDELMADMPQYPGAVLISGTELRTGPGAAALTGHPGPRGLEVCYMTDAPMSKVADFYERELKERGWKLVEEQKRFRASDKWFFSKGRACVLITDSCPCVKHNIAPDLCPDARQESDIYPTAYQVYVHYELNELLGFPGIPDGGCP
jgi:hypothetical protein